MGKNQNQTTTNRSNKPTSNSSNKKSSFIEKILDFLHEVHIVILLVIYGILTILFFLPIVLALVIPLEIDPEAALFFCIFTILCLGCFFEVVDEYLVDEPF